MRERLTNWDAAGCADPTEARKYVLGYPLPTEMDFEEWRVSERALVSHFERVEEVVWDEQMERLEEKYLDTRTSE